MSEIKSLTLNVNARSPFEIYYEGPANAVSAANSSGAFDILPGHANFFSIINPDSAVIVQTEKETINIGASNGIVCVDNDEVLLFLNI